MKQIVEVPIQVPTSWKPPYVEDNIEDSENPLHFVLTRSWSEPKKFVYLCEGCLSAGGEVEDVFRSEPFSEEENSEVSGVLVRIKHELRDHANQHEIMWRWAFNRMSSKVVCK